MKVMFLHPDLGIGGAERLIVDVALALKRRGHEVCVYTNRHSPTHCFAETADGTLDVRVLAGWLPRSLFGRCRAACAYLRFIVAALYLAFVAIPKQHTDVLVCDLISACVPFVKLSPSPVRVLYYCHHPDRLLSPPGGLLKRLYRIPIDRLEAWSTAAADAVLVNSEYTKRVFQNAFPRITRAPEVLYPSIDVRALDAIAPILPPDSAQISPDSIVFLSINRYERKKNLGLALGAIRRLKPQLSDSDRRRLRLVIAGGYDTGNDENVQHFRELIELAKSLDVEAEVRFLRSPSDAEKVALLRRCDAVVYTPSDEHFGIVPLEAMYFCKPVLAVNSGGPTETVVTNVTGRLCAPDEAEFAAALKAMTLDPDARRRMGEAGRQRFNVRFSYDAFEEQIDGTVRRIAASKKSL